MGYFDWVNSFSLASQEKYPKSWQFFGNSSGGTKMADPTLLSAIISGGSSLLSGLLSGIQKGKAAKELKQATKPKTPYYETFSVLPYLQQLLQTSLIGALRQELPQSSEWGIDFDTILRQLNKNIPKDYIISSPYSALWKKYIPLP